MSCKSFAPRLGLDLHVSCKMANDILSWRLGPPLCVPCEWLRQKDNQTLFDVKEWNPLTFCNIWDMHTEFIL